jgi:hypothetical protein
MTNFGLITEGLTDQIVIEYILAGYFQTPNIDVAPLQPERDKDNENKSQNYGGWSQVFAYCQSQSFRDAFPFFDYIIIQIDTDVSENYDIPKLDENGEFTPEELIKKVRNKFQEVIGEDFYSKYQEKIIFAISVHSIECWFLPLYYPDKKHKSKFKNCLNTLNPKLKTKHDFTIDANSKNPDYSRKISKQYLKHKVLMTHYQENPSFRIFIEEIEGRNIVIEEEEF